MAKGSKQRGAIVALAITCAALGCTAILGADKDYHEVGTGGAGTGAAGAGAGVSSGSRGSSGTLHAATGSQTSVASSSGSASAGSGTSSSGSASCQLGMPCGSPACTGDRTGSITPTCDGNGVCVSQKAVSCYPYQCDQQSGVCSTSCSGNFDCANGYTCQSGTCACKTQCGEACSTNSDCGGAGGQDKCLGGFCCAGYCNGSFGGANGSECGATACTSGTGECVYPGPTTTCNGGPSCKGNTFQPGVCDGLGDCRSAVTCPGGFLCGSTTECATSCGAAGSANCQTNYYCDGTGAGACQKVKALGAACAAAYECGSGICTGGSCAAVPVGSACTSNAQCADGPCLGNCCSAACASDGTTCGGTCAASTGACNYPMMGGSCAGGLSCSAGQIHPDVCDGAGHCNSAGTACANGYACATTTTCATSCGTTAGSAGCQSGYYCDGVAPGTCQAQLAIGTACTQNYQCVSPNVCSGTCI